MSPVSVGGSPGLASGRGKQRNGGDKNDRLSRTEVQIRPRVHLPRRDRHCIRLQACERLLVSLRLWARRLCAAHRHGASTRLLSAACLLRTTSWGLGSGALAGQLLGPRPLVMSCDALHTPRPPLATKSEMTSEATT